MPGVVVLAGGHTHQCKRKARMSFKREGDDSSQLSVLKKRRVADLLAHYIPEDEALLLRDGRYACTMCFHRPVFDTLDMLAVHRSGKKHLASLQKFYGKKRSLENEVQKRQHQAYLQAEERGAQAAPGPAPLLLQTKKIAQNALLKTAPYNSCCRRNRSAGSDPGLGCSGTSPDVRAPEGAELCKPSSATQRDRDGPIGVDATSSAHLPGLAHTATSLQKETSRRCKKTPKGKASSIPTPASEPEDLTPEKRQALEHYLRLKSSGWIQESSGKWVKDENVEFDSDEEEPPGPALS
ncbi:sodium channel modifier 1 [Heteronotia binoei]|uniref:sodium channel modifier 1 n=1 Tax=Heteronotia binoei TaxID=13085 RepID=UPI002931848C|nr:sodium channel modifier 1 [Heteronotia binoei]